METLEPLTNEQRRGIVSFLVDAYKASDRRPFDVLDDDARTRFGEGGAEEQRRVFFTLLCYAALAAQPAPEAVVQADWQRFVSAGLIDQVYEGSFDLPRFAVSPPVSRSDSRGKVIDFVRLAERRETWSRLLPQPGDPTEVVDLLHAASGGTLKSRAFWTVREMLRYGLWPADGLARSAFLPDGRVRKRAVRMGLVDLPENADRLEDMKTVSAALHAATGLAGSAAREYFDLPISLAGVRCEICDTTRMATCPVPCCRWREQALRAHVPD
ncbi:MAG TPA: hypothetical protein VJ787_07885 [Thermoleophilia bacterium]|nr:hypothetical protein [Thermoleophilia bacterium]